MHIFSEISIIFVIAAICFVPFDYIQLKHDDKIEFRFTSWLFLAIVCEIIQYFLFFFFNFGA